MSGFYASLFNIHGNQYMEVNMILWMSRFSYRSAIFNGYADYLSILTFIVSFGFISGGHCDRLMAFRCLQQIFTDLLWKRRPPLKPPWNHIIRILPFWLSTNVKKDMEIMDLSWAIFTTTTFLSDVGGFLFSALMLGVDANRMRIRRSNQQHIWVYAIITTNYIYFFRRVPKSMVLRCNGWIADFDFRKRKRWCIEKKKMFPKLESSTRLTDKTTASKHIIWIAAPELLCCFVTKIFDCVYTLMFNIVIFGSY